MIISTKVVITLNPANVKRYEKLGYDNLVIGNKIEILVKDLLSGSHTKILVSCDCCGVQKEITYCSYLSYGYGEYYFCRKCKMKKNNMEKYGVENVFQLDSVKEKSKQTIKEKYDVEYISQSIDIKEKIRENYINKSENEMNEIYNKRKKTVKEKYNVDNISQLDFIKNKKTNTCLKNNNFEYVFLDPLFRERLIKDNLEKYGVEFNLQAEEIKDKIIKTNMLKYGVKTPSMNEKIKQKIKETNISTYNKKILINNENILSIDNENKIFTILCENCKKEYDITYSLFYKRRETKTTICTNCNIIDRHQSGLEIQLIDYIKKNYIGEIKLNYRKIINKELDIYLPDLNLAFEFNGVYWHNELYKPKNYHRDKTKDCINNGIKLIHIWEDDWIYKQEIIKSFILNKLGKTINKISSRKCEIKQITNINIIRDFLNSNHLQGYTGSNIKLGLYHNNELVSLMTFRKSYELNRKGYELNRFCNKLNTNVQGSASKLLKYFINNFGGKIYTFADLSYSYGELYETIGFSKEKNIPVSYSYVVDGIRKHKFNFRKRETGLTEHETMLKNNIYRIYDCGKIKYTLC